MHSRALSHLPEPTALTSQVVHQSRAYLQSLSTQADIMSRGPASTDIAYHIAINMYHECMNMLYV